MSNPIFIRLLKRNKFLSFVTILGFALGIGIFTLLLTYIKFDFNADKQHVGYDKIYRVSMDHIFTKEKGLPTLGDLAANLRSQIPEIESACNIIYKDKINVKFNEEVSIENKLVFADTHLHDLFNFEVQYTHGTTDLSTPNVALISKAVYEARFINISSDNMVFYIPESESPIQIVGYFSPVGNTHLDFEILVSKSTLKDQNPFSNIGLTYIKSKEGIAQSDLEGKLNEYSNKLIPHFTDTLKLYLESLSDVYFDTAENPYSGILNTRNKEHLIIFSAVSLLVLIIALLNILNLSFTDAILHIKEIKIKKILGLTFYRLLKQFFIETAWLILISTVLILGAIRLVIPHFNELFNSKLTFSKVLSFDSVLTLIIILFCSVLIRAFAYLLVYNRTTANIGSSQGASEILKFKFLHYFLIFQFALSFILIISYSFLDNKLTGYLSADLGFDYQNGILINFNDERVNINQLKLQLINYPSIVDATVASGTPFEGFWFSKFSEENEAIYSKYYVDNNYLNVFDINLVSGRNFNETEPQNNIIVNKEFIKNYSNLFGAVSLNDEVRLPEGNFKIIGVTNDFITTPNQTTPAPAVFTIAPNPMAQNYLILKHQSNFDLHEFEKYVKNVTYYNPEFQRVENLYFSGFKSYFLLDRLISMSVIISVSFTVIGLIAFIMFISDRRLKEMAIRKVNGAHYTDILSLFLIRIFRIFVIGLIVSIPFAYGFLKIVLEEPTITFGSFQYLKLTALIAMVFIISLGSILFIVIKASRVNPTVLLRE